MTARVDATKIFREDRGWQIAWPAALCFATLFHGFAFAVASQQEQRPKPPPITMAIVRPPPPKIEAPPEPPKPEPPKPKPPPPKPVVEAAPPPLPKIAETPPEAPPQEVPLAVVPVELGPQTGQGVAVPLGSPDGTEGAKPVSGTADVKPVTNIASARPAADFDARGYRSTAIALVNKQKRYPRKAIVLGLEGRCRVKVGIDHAGAIVQGPTFHGGCTGHDALDEEALRMVRAAAPFAPLPAHVRAPHILLLDIDFSLTDARGF